MERKKYIFALLTFILTIWMTAGISWAVTVNVSPNPAIIGQNVVISATASFLATPCSLDINFGDGAPVYVQN